ncbi:DUF3150 domain-containing protein [Methylococcus sp. EFPC2]|uniref:DUF3150 domain-containing protein n=1 Tax=Methylococcus sp. EFPC2 TaxID=2812648 RepID=UPI0019686006|nr:DUF3150 domain-containing protein [Methylococcus sp. EFPC2]QSA98054.1 DUF3150 domain-containing protein [Methylococcus sp. EFPC2]
MQETTLILDRLLVVKLDATIWGGRKKLRKEDLILADGSVLPPEDLASLGSKKIADPGELAVFNRLKKEAERICLKVGTRFLGGFAVPEGAIGSIRCELDRIASSFETARGEFLSRYDESISDWVAKHPAFAQAICRAVDPVDVVAAGLRFDYVVFRVSQPESLEGESSQEIAESLSRKVESMSDNLFREVAQDANDLVEHSLLGRQSVTRKALSPFKRIRDKLDGLAFLDHRVSPVVQSIDALLSRVPKVGALDGVYLQEVFAFALLLSDPEKIKRHGEGLSQEALSPSVTERRAPPMSVPDEEPHAELDTLTTPDSPSESSAIDRFGLFEGIEEEMDTDEVPAEAASVEAEVLIPALKPELDSASLVEFWF